MGWKATVAATAAVTVLSMVAKDKNEERKGSELPSFKNVVEVKSYLPGRLRLYVPKVAARPDLAENMKKQLAGIEEIKEVEINYLTQSVVIVYNKKIISPDLLIGAIVRLMQAEEETEKNPNSFVGNMTSALWQGLDYGLMNYTDGFINASQAVAGAFLGVGIKKIMDNGFVVPPAATLFWWASGLLRKSGANV